MSVTIINRTSSPQIAATWYAPVAQLDRAPDYESGGQEFESLRARHFYARARWIADSEHVHEVGEIRHKSPIDAWDGGFAPGLDPARGDYASFANFSDPDGNSWVVQERGYRNL